MISLLTGIIAGILDIIPMIIKKLNKYEIISAFMFHLIMPFVYLNLNLNIIFWFKGPILYLLCSLPIATLMLKQNKKTFLVILINSVVIGELVALFFFIYI